MDTYQKQPGDVLDFDVDYSRWLPEDDTLSGTPTVTIAPTGELACTAVQVSPDSQVAKVWLSGGTDKATYKVTVTATTTGGRVKETEFKIRVKDI